MPLETDFIRQIHAAAGMPISDGNAVMAARRLGVFTSFIADVRAWRAAFGDADRLIKPYPTKFQPYQIIDTAE